MFLVTGQAGTWFLGFPTNGAIRKRCERGKSLKLIPLAIEASRKAAQKSMLSDASTIADMALSVFCREQKKTDQQPNRS